MGRLRPFRRGDRLLRRSDPAHRNQRDNEEKDFHVFTLTGGKPLFKRAEP
jgi:hypothetical protein